MTKQAIQEEGEDLSGVHQMLEINGRPAVTVGLAQDILTPKFGRKPTRDTVLRMFHRGEIQGERTPSANLYYVDSLENVTPRAPGTAGRRPQAYTEEQRQEAVRLSGEGKSISEIAQQLDVPRQMVRYWLVRSQKAG